MEISKILKRYGGVILFAFVVTMKIARLTIAHEYEFAATFCLWVILSFLEGWLTHSLFINPKFFELRKDNIELMQDNLKLMDMIKEEREKNGSEA